ncbi:unnamed protein product [Phaeothamnion confervicola]
MIREIMGGSELSTSSYLRDSPAMQAMDQRWLQEDQGGAPAPFEGRHAGAPVFPGVPMDSNVVAPPSPQPPAATAGGLTPRASDEEMRRLVMQKTQELSAINDFRFQSLERVLAEREEALEATRATLDRLKEDFRYNLSLIDDRDRELDRYEVAVADLTARLRESEAEASELRTQMADAAAAAAAADSRSAEVVHYWQAKCKDLKAEIETARATAENAQRRQREAVESMRTALQRELRDRDDDMEAQRRDMAASFDELMRQREAELRRRDGELTSQLKDMESAATQAAKAAAKAREEAAEQRREAEKAAVALAEARKELRTLRWQLDDSAGVTAAALDEERAARAAAEAALQEAAGEHVSELGEA